MKRIISILFVLLFVVSVPFSAYGEDLQFGYDVSHNNSVLNEAVFSNKNDFVMIRLGYTTNHIDRNFLANVKSACENKIPYGVYFYSYAYNDEEAKGDADFVIDTLSQLGEYKEYLKYPVAYDLEEQKIADLGKNQVTRQLQIFCSEIENAGYVPMVYANTYWFNNYIDTNIVKNNGYKVWFAWYSSGTPDFSTPVSVGNTGLKADIWQYKKGDANKGTLDENVAYDYESLTHIYKRDSVLPAQTGKNGNITYRCSICGSTQTETISAPKTFSLSNKSYTYDGKAKKPTVSIKDSQGNTINKSNYTVSYTDNKNVGTAKATVKFKGDYSGTKSLSFAINPKGTSISKLTAVTGGFNVRYGKQTAQTTGYQIRYADNKSFKNTKTLTVSNNKTVSKTVKKLKKNKKYFVQVRTYKVTKSKKYFSSWSKTVTVKTK